MGKETAASAELRWIIDAALRGELTEAMARRMYAMGQEATVAVALAVNAALARSGLTNATGPHTPSSAIPVYAKPSASKRGGRRGTPGARDGHEGHRRAPPPIDRVEEVADLKTCPECKNPVRPARQRRRRTVEDMPQQTRVEAVEYVIPQHWCPCCKKHVEPGVAAALPNATIGNGIVALTCVFHYGLGLTIDQTREVLLSPLQTRITPGGLVAKGRGSLSSVVRADRERRQGFGGAARGRDGMAGQRRHALAVVLLQHAQLLLHDR
jgi:hypothetical protein